ncbi:MAG: TIGR02281 family clan AA aspartic protease [Comamonas sp.]|jgi:aspartyl protease family protein|uniref:retropepsin-like aspartic protease family protein n=1 Tax=Comamonas sp. TaxID=34028 RepID=UPI0012C2E55A|nr:TIGR02281 family clan AA aspartic protease [Comamonas sp.]MDR3067673.1 TIGR02281 family clan AA aspartic protease [Comamonas sp.]MPS94773.1 TIGR02281 family clan AA aspartic protease [Comamonas sp.]
MRLNVTPPPQSSSQSVPSPQSVARRSTLLFLLFWLVVMAAMYLAMQHFLKPAQAKVMADGTVRIERGMDGHFRVKGYVNDQPVTFLVDTGASSVSVTDALAERAGLEGGEKVRFRTANGERDGRIVTADEVRIASLRVRDVRVGTGYTGDDSEDALLGQNFLRFFDVQMGGDEMLLRPRK